MEKKEKCGCKSKLFLGIVIGFLIATLLAFGLCVVKDKCLVKVESSKISESKSEISDDDMKLAEKLLDRHFIDGCYGFRRVGELFLLDFSSIYPNFEKEIKEISCTDYYDLAGVKYKKTEDGIDILDDNYDPGYCSGGDNFSDDVVVIPYETLSKITNTLYGTDPLIGYRYSLTTGEGDYLKYHYETESFYILNGGGGGTCGPSSVFYKIKSVDKYDDLLKVKVDYIDLYDLNDEASEEKLYGSVSEDLDEEERYKALTTKAFDYYADKAEVWTFYFIKDGDNYYLANIK